MSKQFIPTKGIDRMRQARARLMLNQLFFGTAATALKLVENPWIDTCRTDGKQIEFRPDFVNELEIGQVEFVLCHEVMHCILLHPLRLQGRDFELANMAMDYVVNGILTRSGMKVLEGCLWDEELSAKEMSFERVYAILKKKQQEEKKQKKGSGQGQGEKEDQSGNGQGNDQGEGEGSSGGSSGKKKENATTGQPEGKSGTSQGTEEPGDDSGEGNGPGKSKPWEIGQVTEPKGEDGTMLSESERSNIEQDWKITAQRAFQASNSCGKVPDGMERIIQEMTVEKRDLEDVLRDFVQKTLNGDYSYRKPNRKQIIHDIYTPSVESSEIPTIVMVQDTSGSIGDKELNYFTAKINSVLSEYNTHLHVVYCDSACHDGGEYDRDDLPIKLKPLGGGGTDFRPAFKWIEKMDIEPTCLIYFTDGACERFPTEPDYPVLWALYGDKREFPFGEVVNINPDE